MRGAQGAGAAALHSAGDGGEKDVASTARYIPMPESLWALRHRFPNVTRSVLLQCVRCHRWVAQPVTKHPPDEVATYPTLLGKAASKTKGDRHQKSRTEKEEPKEEWRSPRLRQHYQKVVEAVKPQKPRIQEEPKERISLYIPNPANFTCQWSYCALEDVWADLRGNWLGDLYATLDGAMGNEEGGNSSSKSTRLRRSPQSQNERINEELTRELHGKRSERLAKKPYNGMDVKQENSESNGSAVEPPPRGRMAQQVDKLIHHDEAVVASFCWVSCDSCGKLRHVDQPFPGGAPFVCALALNIGSCSVPEQEGLGPVFSSETDHLSAGDKSVAITGDAALRVAIEAQAFAATPTAAVASTGNEATKLTARSERRGFRRSAGGLPSACKSRASVELSLPLLRELTSALRKRALGTFVKNIMMIPEEVRAKREDVARASLVVSEDTRHMDSVSPKRECGESDGKDAQNSNSQREERDNSNQEQEEEEKRSGATGEEKDTNGASDGTVTCVAETHRGEEAPRPYRRLGCPPRRALWKTREGTCPEGALTRVDLLPLPLGETTRSAEVAELPTTVKLEAVRMPCEVSNSIRTIHESPNGNSAKRETSVSPLEASTVSSAEVPIRESFTKNISGRKRTRRQSNLKDVEENNDDDNKIYTTQAAKPQGVKRRGRKPRRVENDETNNTVNEEEVEIIHWVCCDLCDKWRIVPEKISEDTEHWYCDMRADGTTCSDTDDEIRMNRLEKRGRRRGRKKKKI
ncbi:hypothetical protein ECC02_001958 [Trypanosoma cruzi]|uniref:CW-type domain-containing protein n=1 Tax=Trypanosoma cruzi TaxID=5693 RepID=A0A7J6YEJ1_TRYCR|nr:hypothetical protein ECC02_001958 [Trypanosoma cruzi]